jgi:hypothetical protein
MGSSKRWLIHLNYTLVKVENLDYCSKLMKNVEVYLTFSAPAKNS